LLAACQRFMSCEGWLEMKIQKYNYLSSMFLFIAAECA